MNVIKNVNVCVRSNSELSGIRRLEDHRSFPVTGELEGGRRRIQNDFQVTSTGKGLAWTRVLAKEDYCP